MFKFKNLKRKELVKILDEFHEEIKDIKPEDISNKLLSKNYVSDKRFVTYCRRDFLKQEMTDRLKQKSFTSINYKLEAFYDLEDYIKNDTWISKGSIPTSKDADSIIKNNDSYKNDGEICEEEKNILVEMINEFLEFLKIKVFEISHYNFGVMGPHDWNHTIWEIYEDHSIVKKDYYNGEFGIAEEATERKCNMIIKDNDFYELKKLFELAKTIEDTVDACDGDAWGFSYYENNNLVWSRDVSYIYGIRVLEEISKMITKLDTNLDTNN